MIVEQPDAGHIKVTGADRVRFLQGLTTCNVERLGEPGDDAHTWGAILSPKGRVLSIIELVREPGPDGAIWVHTEPSLADKTLAILEKHAMLDEVAFERVDGPAHRVWIEPADVWTAQPILGAPPTPAAPDGVIEILRVEAGFPRYGVDVDEDCFPFETPLGRFLDYDKGCYVGQEPVFRVHSQGKAARAMRGLLVEGDHAVPRGAVVAHPAKAEAGAVTSSVVAPHRGVIAMAYLHRTAWEVGGAVTVDGRAATVVELPFV